MRRQAPVSPEDIAHVTCRAPARRVLFADDEDRRRYIALLAEQVALRGWQVFTYCLLSTHLHLVVRTPRVDLPAGLQIAHERHAIEFNRRWDEHGSLFSNGPHYTPVTSDAHLFAALRYVARNPVAAGLCAAPADWPWGAHRALVGLEPLPAFLDAAASGAYLSGPLRIAYAGLVTADDRQLVAEIRRSGALDWIRQAIDEHRVDVATVAAEAGVSTRRVYQRLAAERASLKGGTLG